MTARAQHNGQAFGNPAKSSPQAILMCANYITTI
jgi:hypothetical protein